MSAYVNVVIALAHNPIRQRIQLMTLITSVWCLVHEIRMARTSNKPRLFVGNDWIFSFTHSAFSAIGLRWQ
jgi:fumarate reductase subunit D